MSLYVNKRKTKKRRQRRLVSQTGLFITLLLVVSYSFTTSSDTPAYIPPVTEKTVASTTEAAPKSSVFPTPAIAAEEDTVTEGVKSPNWEQIHDYSTDQPALSPTGVFKNLTIQPGNSQSELHVTWYSTQPGDGSLLWEKDEAGFDYSSSVTFHSTSMESAALTGYYRNQAVVTGLKADTAYHYRFGNNGQWSDTYSYRTHSFTGNYEFTIVSDVEIGLGDYEDGVLESQTNGWRLSLNRIADEQSDSAFIMTVGDQVAVNDAPEQYDNFLDQSVLYSTMLMPVMGNHDVGSGFYAEHFYEPNQSPLGTSQGDDGDYWYRYGNTLYMVLNTSTVMDQNVHKDFVEAAVAENQDAKWRVVISHIPSISGVESYQDSAEQERDLFFEIQTTYNIDFFFSGHDHLYTRSFFMDNGNVLSDGTEHSMTDTKGAVFMVFNTASGCMYRDSCKPLYSAFDYQSDEPQISKASVTDSSFTVTTYNAITYEQIDTYTILK